MRNINKLIIRKNSYKIILCFILLHPVTNFCQESIIKGFILDSLDRPIEYVNIGIVNKPIGTVSNEKGEFSLNINKTLLLDTLRISSIGYKTRDFIINEFLNQNTKIKLKSYTENLDEVLINAKKLKSYTRGKDKIKTKNEVFFAIPSLKELNLGSEIGRKFSVGSKKPSLLEEFKFYIKKNNFEKVKFRINIYSIENNKPHKKLNNSNIIIEIENKYTGWTTVDLGKYQIKTKDDIIVTAEWIEASKTGNQLSLPILVPSFGSIHYYKYGSQSYWKKFKMVSSSMVLKYKQ